VWEKTQLQTEALRSSVKLCQVGIGNMHSGAFKGTLLLVQKEESESLTIM
jgi:hypothetical protein